MNPNQPRHSPPKQGVAPQPGEQDSAMQEYLRGLDLQGLDLDGIDLDVAEGPSQGPGPGRWFIALALWVLLFWLPSTNYYQLHGQGFWLVIIGACAAYATGFTGLHQLRNLAARLSGRPSVAMPTWHISPGVTRAALLFGGLGLGGIMLFAMPREAEWQGHGYSARWFIGVGVALTAGILLGRWLIMHADRKAATPRPPRQPIVMPPWFKWATLAVLVAGGLFAAFGHHFLSGDPDTNTFALGGIGFAVGLLGAIWLAHRFDELEAQIREQKRRQ